MSRFTAVLALALLAGCAPSDIDQTYGRRRGAPGGTSVNGTAVLAGMFERAGHRVSTWRRLSPKLEQFAVIVWAPNDFRPPTEEQREYLEGWLRDENGRTLVYIGRDYDAAITYWRTVQPQAPPDQMMEASRRRATAQANYEAERARMPKDEHCDWFTVRRDGVRRKLNRLQGPWSEGIDAAEAELEIAARLDFPTDEETDDWAGRGDSPWRRRPQFEALLQSGGDVLVSRVRVPREWDDSQIIVVVNGSFLLNLPLVNHQHRRLAGKLISACGPPSKVAFLESDRDGPKVYDKEPDANAPTGFEVLEGAIALHLMVLGITLCFAMFPIFGRPDDLEDESLSDFGKHAEALGELLELTRDRQYAEDRVRQYQEQVRRDSAASHRREQDEQN